MTSASGLGYVLIALGPAFSLFFLVIAHRPFLVLTVLSSALIWLVTLVLIAGLWRASLPLQPSFWIFAVLLFSAVGVQEVVRGLLWRVFQKLEIALDSLAAKSSKPRLSVTDKLEVALAAGLGHGLAHSVFFCLSVLTPAFGPATFYVSSCRLLPYFLAVALASLGFLIIHTSGMVIAFIGYMDGNRGTQLVVPVIHLIASYSTMVNMIPGGCIYGISFTLFVAAISAGVCGRIIWNKTGPVSNTLGSGYRTCIG